MDKAFFGKNLKVLWHELKKEVKPDLEVLGLLHQVEMP